MTEADIAAVAVVLACFCLLVWKLSTRMKHRFGTFGSALIKAPAYRALFVLVLIGIVVVSTVPEAALVLPAVDAVGLDVVTILVAFELRHYLASMARLVIVSRCGAVLRTHPALWLYAFMWPVIWLRTCGIR